METTDVIFSFLTTHSNWDILCTYMRTDEFIDTARMYGVIFKYMETNSSGETIPT